LFAVVAAEFPGVEGADADGDEDAAEGVGVV
jgi:hypothetical protein